MIMKMNFFLSNASVMFLYFTRPDSVFLDITSLNAHCTNLSHQRSRFIKMGARRNYIFLVVASLIVNSIQSIISREGLSTHDRAEYELCTTEACVIAAATIIEALDETIDPCQDFYQFSCGGWEASNDIPATSGRWSQFDVLDDELNAAMSRILTEPQSDSDPVSLNQVKTFYDGCMDETIIESVGLTPLQAFLDQFGGWPMSSASWDESVFDWQVAVGESRRQIGAEYLISIYVAADEKDAFSTITYIDQSSLGLSRTVLVTPEDYEELITAYKQYISSSAALLSGSTPDQTVIDADVEAVFAFETALAAITTPSEDRRDNDRMYNPMTIDELQTLTGSSINWISLLDTAFSSAGITFSSTETVIVRETQFIQDLVALLQSTDARTLSNYILWRQVMDLGSDTNQAMRDIIFQYDTVAMGITSASERSDVCAGKSNRYLGFAIGLRYVQQYFSQQAKDDTLSMVADIRSAFQDLLTINDWMDEETKPLAQEKADYVSELIGYPDFYEDNGGLDEYYNGITGIDASSHFNNVLTLALFSSTDGLDALGLPAERTRFLAPPTIVNAWYAPEYNSITFPAGILQPPFYWQNALQVLNYGSIGQVIGHELTHGFDDQGSQYDKYGNTVPWWSNDTIAAFEERAQCIIDQYSNYVVEQIGENLNGVNTQGENIADNGGLREAYLAYQKYVNRNGTEPRLPGLESYTAEQLFFISNANIWCSMATDEKLQDQILTDPHSPGPFRVRGPVSNMEQFATAFNCASGTPMNPVDKCVVW